MTAITISAPEIAELSALWARAPEVTEKHLRAALEKSLMLLQREVAEATPTGAHHLLRKSIIAEPVRKLSGGLLGVVDVKQGSALDYAVAVELGTKAHMPPLEPLIDWVQAKLGLRGDEAEGAAHGIRWKIYHHGTKGAFMFQTTFEKQQAEVLQNFEAARTAIVADLGA